MDELILKLAHFYSDYFPQPKRRNLSQRLCVVTRQPAKYIDPVTG